MCEFHCKGLLLIQEGFIEQWEQGTHRLYVQRHRVHLNSLSSLYREVSFERFPSALTHSKELFGLFSQAQEEEAEKEEEREGVKGTGSSADEEEKKNIPSVQPEEGKEGKAHTGDDHADEGAEGEVRRQVPNLQLVLLKEKMKKNKAEDSDRSGGGFREWGDDAEESRAYEKGSSATSLLTVVFELVRAVYPRVLVKCLCLDDSVKSRDKVL